MSTFDDREQAFEAKFAHDADLKFQIISRRNKLFAEWAAGELGLGAEDATAYVRAIIKAEVGGAGGSALLARVKADLAGKGIDLKAGRVEAKLDACEAEAAAQLAGKPKS